MPGTEPAAIAFVGLGSNLADPLVQVRQALVELESIPGTRVTARSSSVPHFPGRLSGTTRFHKRRRVGANPRSSRRRCFPRFLPSRIATGAGAQCAMRRARSISTCCSMEKKSSRTARPDVAAPAAARTRFRAGPACRNRPRGHGAGAGAGAGTARAGRLQRSVQNCRCLRNTGTSWSKDRSAPARPAWRVGCRNIQAKICCSRTRIRIPSWRASTKTSGGMRWPRNCSSCSSGRNRSQA